MVPKGLQLERKFHPISVDGFVTKTRSDIEDILSKAERKIHNVMLDHHKKLIRVINRKLEAVEEKIGELMHHPAASTTIQAAHSKQLQLMERQENSLRLALQRSKQRKSSGASTTSGGGLNTKAETSAGPSREGPNSTTVGPPDGSHKATGPLESSYKSTSSRGSTSNRARQGKGKERRRVMPYKKQSF